MRRLAWGLLSRIIHGQETAHPVVYMGADLGRVGRILVRKSEQHVAERRADLAHRCEQLPDHYVMVSDVSAEIGFEVEDRRVLRAFRLEEGGELSDLPKFDSDGVRVVLEGHGVQRIGGAS